MVVVYLRMVFRRSLRTSLLMRKNNTNEIKSKLQNSVPALPSFTFTNVDEEIALAKRIQTSSCIEHGF